MTVAACRAQVAFLKPIAGAAVIELLNRRRPPDQVEISPIVFSMAFDAASSRPVFADRFRMPSFPGLDAHTNILVAVKAFELGRSLPSVMTVSAPAWSAEMTMRIGQFPRRNLTMTSSRTKKEEKDQNGRPSASTPKKTGTTHIFPRKDV